MTASLAYRKNEAAILRGAVPEKYLRIIPHVPGERIIEIGSAEGVLALLLAKAGKDVLALERNADRVSDAVRLRTAWLEREEFEPPALQIGDIASDLDILEGRDTLVAVRMIYYLGDALDTVFAAVAKYIPNVVLCGNRNRANRWRAGRPDEPLGDFNRYAAREGMRELLERHGYRITQEVTEGDEIVIGVMDRSASDPI